MIAWGAEHGVEEAKKIYESDSPTKFFPYAIYDIPGSIYSIVTAEQYNVPALYQIIPNYWEKVKANVEYAYKEGFLTKAKFDRWMERYNNKDKYLGKEFPPHPLFKEYDERRKKELVGGDSALSKVLKLKLPSPAPFYDKK
jgi:hypothetical protein